MDAALYDEFGNYIGPELDASDSDVDQESDGEVRMISSRSRARLRELVNAGTDGGVILLRRSRRIGTPIAQKRRLTRV